MSPTPQLVENISHYQILELLGKGGMGLVYKAKDQRLGRIVALKVLAAPNDPNDSHQQHLALRLEQEARLVSRLSHPNICSLFDFGVESGRIFLVMEYLEGPTLAERILDGPLPFEECLKISSQVASALQHAHGERMIHRDIKPGNIMLTRHGAKLLDFGLARQERPATQSSPGFEDTMDITQRLELTTPGMLMGSFPYMPPEQLRGQPADARSDLFSLGVVMYEMSCGTRPFGGASAADLSASLLKEDPPSMTKFRPGLSPVWQRLVNRALAKDPAERWQSAADLKEAIEMVGASQSSIEALSIPFASGSGTIVMAPPAESVASQVPVSLPPLQDTKWRRSAGWIGAATVLAVAGFFAGSAWRTSTNAPAVPNSGPTRFVIPSPGKYGFALAVDSGGAAFSPDGRYIVFISAGERPSRLWLRPLDSAEARPLTGTEGAFAPFWSPDSAQIGFFAGGVMKKIRISDGSIGKIAEAAQGRGGSWAPDGTILFTPADVGGTTERPLTVVFRTNDQGAEPRLLYSLNKTREESGRDWPFFLPDGKHYLFVARSNKPDMQALYVGSSDGSGTPQMLRQIQSNVQFMPVPKGSKRGFLFFLQDGSLMAQPFDSEKLAITGDARLLAEKVGFTSAMRVGFFSVSPSGSLLYSAAESEIRNITLLRRDGTSIRNYGEPSSYYSPKISRDGRNLFVSRFAPTGTNADLWYGSLAEGGRLQRFTFEDSHEAAPVWSPDGSEVAYSVIENSIFQLQKRNLRTSDRAVPLTDRTSSVMRPFDWSNDGKLLLYVRSDERNRTDIWGIDMASGYRNFAITKTPANEVQPQLSPDGKWLAYSSDTSGAFEVYVERMGNPMARSQVSANGGVMPRWKQDGREIYFLTPKDVLMAAPVTAKGETLEIGSPQALFNAPLASRQRMSYTYDVAPDASWFVLLTPLETPEQKEMHVLLNWSSRLAAQ